MLICIGVVLLWFSPWWIGGKNLAPLDILHGMMEPWRAGNEEVSVKNHIVSDSVTQYLIYRMIAGESYRDEGWVGWSSLTYGGTAQHANTMALYGDWTMQLHRWFSFWTAWHLGLMGQVMLAACGMLLWLRGRGIAVGWAVCGALLYAGNSQFVTWIHHRWALGAFCWVPWILWAIEAQRGGQRRIGWLIPVFMALAFLGGTLQHMALVTLVVMAAWLEEAIGIGRGKWREQLMPLARYAGWGILGLALAAPVWLPAADAFLTTNRLGIHTGLHGRSEGIYPVGALQPLLNLAAYPGHIFPSIFGRSDSLDLLKPFRSDLFYVIYFGSLPVILGFMTAWTKRAPLMARILVLAGLLLPLTPLVRPLYQRLYLLFIIGGILAFVHWMQHATEETRRKFTRVAMLITMVVAGCWLTLSAVMQWKRAALEATIHGRLDGAGAGSSFGYFHDWMDGRIAKAIDDLFIWSPQHAWPLMLWAAILCGLWLALRRGNEYRRIGHIIIGIAVVMEVMLFAGRWITWTDPAKFPLYPETAETQLLREHVGRDDRTMTLIHPTHHMARTPFVTNTLAAYGIPSILGYDSIVPNGINRIATDTADPHALGKVGVSHLITWPGNAEVPAGWKEIAATASMTLYENPYRVPRYTGRNKDKWQALEETTGLENRREISIPDGISEVRIAENHAAGWQYRTGGADWENISRSGDGSMVIEIENPRASMLELRYRPPLRRAGFTLCGLAVLVCFGMLLGSAVPKRKG